MIVSKEIAETVKDYCTLDKKSKLYFWKFRLNEVDESLFQMKMFKGYYPLSFYDVDFAIINLDNARLKILDIIKGIENGNELSA